MSSRETPSPEKSLPSVDKPSSNVKEAVVLTRPVDDPEVLSRRAQNIATLKANVEALQVARANAQATEETVRTNLGIAKDATVSPGQVLDNEQLAREEEKIVEAEANYPGDWTLLLHERLMHPSTQKKFEAVLSTHQSGFSDSVPTTLDKEENFLTFQTRQVSGFQSRVEDRFRATGIGDAHEYGKTAKALGTAQSVLDTKTTEDNLIHSGIVFSDATTSKGTPLTPRQKNIIEAHEKGHSIRKFSGPMADEIRQVLDSNVIKALATKKNYITKADEIIERMSQLKNYFGFNGGEVFTRQHLQHSKEHYIADTELDNDMTVFLSAITPATEDQFLKVINEYPI